MAIIKLHFSEVNDDGVHTVVSDEGVFGVRVLTMMDCEKARLVFRDHRATEVVYSGRISGVYSAAKDRGTTGDYYTFQLQDRRSILDPPSPYVGITSPPRPK